MIRIDCSTISTRTLVLLCIKFLYHCTGSLPTGADNAQLFLKHCLAAPTFRSSKNKARVSDTIFTLLAVQRTEIIDDITLMQTMDEARFGEGGFLITGKRGKSGSTQ